MQSIIISVCVVMGGHAEEEEVPERKGTRARVPVGRRATAPLYSSSAVQRWKTGVKPFSSGHRRKKEKGSAALFAVASPAAATAYSLVEEKECVVVSFEKML